MEERQKEMLIKDGKFYNTDTATLVTKHPSDGKMYKHYKSKNGNFYRTKVDLTSSGEERGLEGIIDVITINYVRNIYQSIKASKPFFTKGEIVNHIKELSEIQEI